MVLVGLVGISRREFFEMSFREVVHFCRAYREEKTQEFDELAFRVAAWNNGKNPNKLLAVDVIDNDATFANL